MCIPDGMEIMKKFFFITILSLATLITPTMINSVEAQRGCCSRHGGVCNCACCDGTPLSAKCQDMCGGETYKPAPKKVYKKTTPAPKKQVETNFIELTLNNVIYRFLNEALISHYLNENIKSNKTDDLYFMVGFKAFNKNKATINLPDNIKLISNEDKTFLPNKEKSSKLIEIETDKKAKELFKDFYKSNKLVPGQKSVYPMVFVIPNKEGNYSLYLGNTKVFETDVKPK